MTPEEKRLFEAAMAYRERFGDDAVIGAWEWPGEYPDNTTLVALYEHCLETGQPLRDYITPMPLDPDKMY